jgi:hypothetical protein
MYDSIFTFFVLMEHHQYNYIYENDVPLLFNVGMQGTSFVQNQSSMNMVHSYNEIGSKDS